MMKRPLKYGIQLGLYGLILAGAACSRNSSDTANEDASSAVDSGGTVSAEKREATTSGMTITEQGSAAIADLATREGIDEDAIIVQRASQVTWGSSALGCPQPGMSYTQALVPGVWVILATDDSVYYYLGREGGSLSYCPADRFQQPMKASKDSVM